jgi:hypothetical protein
MALVENVDKPQLLEVVLGPGGGFNRLFIFTGTAVFTLPEARPPTEDNLIQERLDLSLTRVYNNRPFSRNTTQVVASASPSSIHGTSRAAQFTWAVDRAFADISPESELVLHVDAAIQGRGGLFSRFAYQVFLQTFGMQIREGAASPPSPITVSTTAVSLGVTLFFSFPNPGGRVNFSVILDGNLRPASDLGLPDSIDVGAGEGSAAISGTIRPNFIFPPRTANVDLACTTTLGVFLIRMTITQT